MKISRIRLGKWLPHILGIVIIIVLPLLAVDRNNTHYKFWLYSYYYQLAFLIAAFYVNFLVLVPRYYFSKKKVYFILGLILLAVLLLTLFQFFYGLLDFDNLRTANLPRPDRLKPRGVFGLHPKLIDHFFLLLLVLGFSTGMAIMHRLVQNENKHKEIEKARMDTELAFLKNQISPHFFFNSLNNIYALIAIDGPKAQQAVEKLAGLMRYLIYESDTKIIDLQKEFTFTRNYIDLMQQRLTSKVKLDVDIMLNVPEVKIPPLIFIPFIENAFKHGVSYRELSFINISLKAEEDIIIFKCANSIAKQKEEDSIPEGGLGIQNIRKRLDLIYGDSAELSMKTEDSTFIVSLMLPISLEP